MNDYQLEACVETLEEAKIAQEKGAHQIELCDQLYLGGTTPPRPVILEAKQSLQLKIKVMIRPRGGNFVYTEEEFDLMRADIQLCKNLGINGVVFGILDKDNRLDLEGIQQLARLAFPMEVTIHRAIDETPDILEAVEQLKAIPEVTSILSAGQAPTAMQGSSTLKKMVEIAGDQLTIIPGGKVTNRNVKTLHQRLKTRVYHGTKIVGPLK